MTVDVELLTVEEAAALLRITPAGLRQLRYRGGAPNGVRVGNRVLYPKAGLVAWLQERGAILTVPGS